MEEYVYEKPVIKKRNITIFIIAISIVVLIILFLGYNQIFSTFNESIMLSQSECEIKMKQWCNDCYSINNNDIGVWNTGGTKVDEAFAKCSNNYYQTDWKSGQDCTGNTINYCLPQIDLPIE